MMLILVGLSLLIYGILIEKRSMRFVDIFLGALITVLGCVGFDNVVIDSLVIYFGVIAIGLLLLIGPSLPKLFGGGRLLK